MAEKLHTESTDAGRKISFLESETTVIALIQGSLAIGMDMPGSETILGAAFTLTFKPGGRNIKSDIVPLNIVRL